MDHEDFQDGLSPASREIVIQYSKTSSMRNQCIRVNPSYFGLKFRGKREPLVQSVFRDVFGGTVRITKSCDLLLDESAFCINPRHLIGDDFDLNARAGQADGHELQVAGEAGELTARVRGQVAGDQRGADQSAGPNAPEHDPMLRGSALQRRSGSRKRKVRRDRPVAKVPVHEPGDSTMRSPGHESSSSDCEKRRIRKHKKKKLGEVDNEIAGKAFEAWTTSQRNCWKIEYSNLGSEELLKLAKELWQRKAFNERLAWIDEAKRAKEHESEPTRENESEYTREDESEFTQEDEREPTQDESARARERQSDANQEEKPGCSFWNVD